MVFGSTYCAISHLPIEDGEKCMLIPLGFNMQYDFDQWNRADINCFMYLYEFIHAPQEVVFNGNPDDIEYLDEKYESTLKHEMYMLVAIDFYKEIQENFDTGEILETTQRLPLYKTVQQIWRKAKKIEKEEREIILNECRLKMWSTEEASEKIMKTITPIWIKEIYKLSMFMDRMGIMPCPSNSVDQHQLGKKYEKMRSRCIKNRNKKDVE